MALFRLDIQTTQRHLVSRGALNAFTWNDSIDEIVTDLANLASEWNLKLVPLLAAVPDGTQDSAVDAYTFGLDGANEYVDSKADTSPLKVRFYNIAKSRPKTIKESIDDIYASMSGFGDIINQTIITGGLTTQQKADIGDHIFNNALTSSPSSLDGLTAAANLNLQQLAKDLYGSSWALNNDGIPILTNSVQAMVNALLVLHNGHWSDDITLSHTGATTSTLNASYVSGASAADQTITLTDADGGPVIVNGIRTSGAWTGTDVFKVQTGRTDVGGSEKTLNTIHKTSTPITSGLSDVPHISVTEQDTVNNTVKDVLQLQSSLYSGAATVAGHGVAVGFGDVGTGGTGGGYKAIGRIGAVVIDPAGATLTSAVTIAGRGEGNAIPAWDDGALSFIPSALSTTNATPGILLSIPIGNSPIRIMQGVAKINASTADGLNFKTWKLDFTLSTAIASPSISIISSILFDGGTGVAWDATLSYSSGDVNITVTGAASTNIKWRAMVELFGLNA